MKYLQRKRLSAGLPSLSFSRCGIGGRGEHSCFPCHFPLFSWSLSLWSFSHSSTAWPMPKCKKTSFSLLNLPPVFPSGTWFSWIPLSPPIFFSYMEDISCKTSILSLSFFPTATHLNMTDSQKPKSEVTSFSVASTWSTLSSFLILWAYFVWSEIECQVFFIQIVPKPQRMNTFNFFDHFYFVFWNCLFNTSPVCWLFIEI